MNRCTRAASSALLALVALIVAPTTAHAAADVNSCVQVAAEAAPAGMSITFNNTCAFEIRCEVAWSLTCEGAEAGAIKDSKRQSFNLQRGRQRAIFASGDLCGDDLWEIVDESWECVQAR
ncbi:MAG: hypothetical protein IPK80_00435 [Nannocystis sp.]|nr:hypothetical protein [Nannocystis sp.]